MPFSITRIDPIYLLFVAIVRERDKKRFCQVDKKGEKKIYFFIINEFLILVEKSCRRSRSYMAISRGLKCALLRVGILLHYRRVATDCCLLSFVRVVIAQGASNRAYYIKITSRWKSAIRLVYSWLGQFCTNRDSSSCARSRSRKKASFFRARLYVAHVMTKERDEKFGTGKTARARRNFYMRALIGRSD